MTTTLPKNVIALPENIAKKCFFVNVSTEIEREQVEDAFLNTYASRSDLLAREKWNDDCKIVPLNDFLKDFFESVKNVKKQETLLKEWFCSGWAVFVFIDEDCQDCKPINNIFVSENPNETLTPNHIGAHYHTLSQLQTDLNDMLGLESWKAVSGEYKLFLRETER